MQGLFPRLLPYLRRHRWTLAAALLATLVVTGLSLLPPLLMRCFVDRVVEPGAWELLPWIGAAIVVVPVSTALVRFANAMIISRASVRLITDVRLDLYERLLNLSLRYHSQNAAGALVGRLMSDVNMLSNLITGNTVQLLVDAIVFVFAISVVFSLHWKPGAILCAYLLLYVVVYRVFSGRIKESTRNYRDLYDQISGRLQETLAGVRQVRSYNREEWETEVFLDRTARSLDQSLATSLYSSALGIACAAISGYGSTFVAGLGAYLVLRGEMTYGDVLAIDAYVWMAVHPAVRLTTVAAQFAETFVSVRRIQEILDEVPDIRSAPDAPIIARGRGVVEFDRIRFSYLPDRPLFDGLFLRVEPGTCVALVGHTGCGKTTLTQLLMRHWDVQAGAIRIDGSDIRAVELGSLRRLFGVVPQEPVVFEGTFAENIAYGAPDASRERIEEAARLAEIHETALRLPQGYVTPLGSRGVNLSLGQKQRVSIARALLTDPLILVLDEATSALDSESEALIQKALDRLRRGRTSFIIAHRLSTITTADLIVVLRDGAIVETGRHEALVEVPGGAYRAFYEQLCRGSDGREP